MGIYTNMANTVVSTDYRSVEPFIGEHFNYHELGIIAATEMATNHNSFMKAIALNELAAYEQTGSTDVLYESVNIKGIFEKIKMFFKKIIEKIHKIFHTFIAKMGSWFGNNKSFAQKYEKEIVKKWANVSNDWEFKGYNFSRALKNKTESKEFSVNCKEKDFESLFNSKENDNYETKFRTLAQNDSDGKKLAAFREKLDDIKDSIRKGIIDGMKDNDNAGNIKTTEINIDHSASGGYDQTEYTEELFKFYRNGEDSKDDLNKAAIEKAYNGSISQMMAFIKDFDSVKKNLEKCESGITKGIDKLIKAMDKAENDLIKTNSDLNKGTDADKNSKILTNERVVQYSSIYQSIWSAVSEILVQAFSALLQANKDACSQAKEIAVKVIGQSKKMTNESYDYGTSTDSGFSFIDSVKLV